MTSRIHNIYGVVGSQLYLILDLPVNICFETDLNPTMGDRDRFDYLCDDHPLLREIKMLPLMTQAEILFRLGPFMVRLPLLLFLRDPSLQSTPCLFILRNDSFQHIAWLRGVQVI